MKKNDLTMIAAAISASMPPSYERDKIALFIVEAIIERYPRLIKEEFWEALAKEDELRWMKEE